MRCFVNHRPSSNAFDKFLALEIENSQDLVGAVASACVVKWHSADSKTFAVLGCMLKEALVTTASYICVFCTTRD